MKYRKKPVVVEAFKYDGDLMGADGKYYVPGWAVRAFKTGVMHYKYGIDAQLYIKTIEGEHHVSVGDYIIRGVGEIYPCKPDIFEVTYEPVLKSCPFCGGEARIRETYWSVGSGRQECKCKVFAECPNCNFSISADTREEAIESWNRRA